MVSPTPSPRSEDTLGRILDAAEQLFAERGFEGTSLRAVTRKAGVNLAAVHYHLGSKEALLHAVFERHITPINQARLENLDRLEASEAEPDLESILEAFLAPALDVRARDPELRDLMAAVFSEPIERQAPLIQSVFGEIAERFLAALGRALPELDPAEVNERMQFAVGAMLHLISGRANIAVASGSELPPEAGLLERLVQFLAAGFRAPPRATRARGSR